MDEIHSPEPPAPPSAAPAAAERLDGRVVGYWYVTELLRAAFGGAALLALSHYLGEAVPGTPTYLIRVVQALAGALVALALVAPPLAYARWSFAVDDEFLRTRSGILFVEERLVPVPRMQHIDLMRGPVERLFGLATLVVFTAGNEGSAFRVPGLAAARAQALRDSILASRGHDVL